MVAGSVPLSERDPSDRGWYESWLGHQLLIVSLAYRKRAIPIAWTWVKHVRGHSSVLKQLALLNYIRKLLPEGAAVFLVGDCEFGSVEVLKWLDQWHWFYVLRQKSEPCV